MMKTCWKWERTPCGVKGSAPGSWNTMVTMSFPMWRFLSSCRRREERCWGGGFPGRGVGG